MRELLLIWLCAVVFWMVCGYGAALMAKYKGYSYWTGIKAVMLLGFVGMMIFAMLPRREPPPPAPVDLRTIWADCPRCGKSRRFYDGFCTTCGTKLPDEP